MAKQEAGFLGGFSGRLGPAVGYMWNGKWCLRSYRRDVANPRTEAQVAHREMFKQEVQLAARLRWAVNTALRNAARDEGMTSYNLFVKLNQHAFSLCDNLLQVDYSALRLSVGRVAPVEPGPAEWSADNVLSVGFGRGSGRGLDYVYLYIYVPTLGSGFLSSPVYRHDKRITLSLPDEYAGHEAHLYLMAQSADGSWSETAYAGCVRFDETIDNEDTEPSDGQQHNGSATGAATAVEADRRPTAAADTGPGRPG